MAQIVVLYVYTYMGINLTFCIITFVALYLKPGGRGLQSAVR